MNETARLDLALLRRHPLPRCAEASDKDARGRLFLIAGSEFSPGAARLAGEAALRAGAGKVLIATPASLALSLGVLAPEFGILAVSAVQGNPVLDEDCLVAQLKSCDACVVGPGFIEGESVRPQVLAVLEHCCRPLVLDAVGLVALKGHVERQRASRAATVITPHAGEMALLMGASRQDVESRPLEFALRAADELGCTVVMKGPTTYIVSAQGATWMHPGGVVGLATAGSGDTLAGLIGALLARGADPMTAAAWGVAVHAKAGAVLSDRYGETGLLARELPGEFPAILSHWN